MAARLYVGNLPYSATEDELKTLFSEAGTVVSVSMPTDRLSGRPRGFGFVEMENDSEAEQAVQKFNGYSMDGRSLRVDLAREREERAPGYHPSGGRDTGYGGGRGGGGGYREGRRPQGRGRGMAA